LQDILTDNRPNSTCNFNVNVAFGNVMRKMGKKNDWPMSIRMLVVCIKDIYMERAGEGDRE